MLNPNAQCDGIWRWGFLGGHEGGPLKNEIGTLRKEAPEKSLIPSAM